MNEEHAELERRFEIARTDLHKYGAEDTKGSHKYEGLYGVAYQQLVAAGLRPQLRKKYRPI